MSSAAPRLSWPAAAALMFLVLTVGAAVGTAIPDDGLGWEILDILVFVAVIFTVLSIWNRARRRA